jgi:hypothetical protein
MTPKTIIRNKTNKDVFLGYVPFNGVVLPANGTVVVDGDLLADLMAGKDKTARLHLKSFLDDIKNNKVDVVVTQSADENVVNVTGNYTVDVNNGAKQLLVVNSTNNVTITLPAPRVGFKVKVFSVVDKNVTVTVINNTTNKFVVEGGDNKVSVAFSTAAENKVGACLEVTGISDTKYAVVKLSSHTLTLAP